MLRRRICDFEVIHDVKDPQKVHYDAPATARSIAEARSIFVQGFSDIIVCRPGISGEEAATLAKDIAEAGTRTLFVGDELTPLLKVNEETLEPIDRVFAGPSLVWLQLQGRGPGASSMILLQLPKAMPGSALDNATAMIYFGTGGRSLAYSLDLRLVPKEAAETVSHLERGQCCIFFPDRDWDGIVYGPE
jgi:hypothetical protein